MRTPALLLTLILALGALAPLGAAAEEDGCRLIRGAETPDTADDVEICRAEAWFADTGSKVGNVTAQDGDFPSWDDSAPTASVATGAGGGYAASSLHQLSSSFDPTYTATFVGEAEGPLDNLLVTMFLFPLQNMAEQAAGDPAGPTFNVDANLFVDGQLVASHGGLSIELEDGGAAVKSIEFAFVDLYTAALGEGTHDVELQLTGTGIASEFAVFVYDVAEAPSSLVFNATEEELDGVAGNPDFPF